MLIFAFAEAFAQIVVVALVLNKLVIILSLLLLLIIGTVNHLDLLFRILFHSLLDHATIVVCGLLFSSIGWLLDFFEDSSIAILSWLSLSTLGFLLLDLIVCLHFFFFWDSRHLGPLVGDEEHRAVFEAGFGDGSGILCTEFLFIALVQAQHDGFRIKPQPLRNLAL